MFKLLPKSKYPTGMLYLLTEHTLIIYVQHIKSSKKNTSYFLEKLFEKDLVLSFQTAFLTLKIRLLIFKDCFKPEHKN